MEFVLSICKVRGIIICVSINTIKNFFTTLQYLKDYSFQLDFKDSCGKFLTFYRLLKTVHNML